MSLIFRSQLEGDQKHHLSPGDQQLFVFADPSNQMESHNAALCGGTHQSLSLLPS